MISFPVYSFCTYFTSGNPYTIRQKWEAQQLVYHFKQKYGEQARHISIEWGDAGALSGRTFSEVSAMVASVAMRRMARIRATFHVGGVPPSQINLVPLPSSICTRGSGTPVGGGGRVADALARAGLGVVTDGLRWTTPQRSASGSDHDDRKGAGERLPELVWIGRGLFKDVILCDDVVSYGDTAACAAERLFLDHKVRVRGLVTIGRTDGSALEDAATPRVSTVAYDPNSGPKWRSQLDGRAASRT